MPTILSYVRGALPDAQRAAAEQHLYECEVCLELYGQCVEEACGVMPIIADGQSFVDKVMRSVELQPVPRAASAERGQRRLRNPLYVRPCFNMLWPPS